VKNRLDSDRRCYGFFHPRLPDEPLIFVEVALVDSIADSITPLLDESAAPADLIKATTADFLLHQQHPTGLRGVSFGDSLIKRVVETLKQEFPRSRPLRRCRPSGLSALAPKTPGAMLESLDEKSC
jgi:malonyl-CoA decarboxylase